MARETNAQFIRPTLLSGATAGIFKFYAPYAGIIVRVALFADTGPVGGDAVFDVNINGSTIFAVPGDRVKITDGNNDGEVTGLSEAIAKDDVITVDFDEFTGTATSVGDDLWIIIEMQETGALATDAQLRDRATHTGTQSGTTIDINGLTEEPAIDSANDFLIVYDASAGGNRKVHPEDLVTAGSGFTSKYKTANESVTSSTVLINDDTLSFAMLANKKYVFRMMVFFTTPAAADLKFRFTGPASPTLVHITDKSQAGGQTGIGAFAPQNAYSASDFTLLGTGVEGMLELVGTIHNGANAGDFQFQWAQNTSNGSPSTVLAGSFIEYRQVD